MWTKLSESLASIRLTIVCLAAAMVLVLAGTFAQVHIGLQIVQEQMFRSLIVFWPLDSQGFRFPVFFGGHLIGAVLMINLVAAHAPISEDLAELGDSPDAWWTHRHAGGGVVHGPVFL